MKKVCIITTVHTALDTRIFFREAKSLRQAGYQVTLIAQYPGKRAVIDGVAISGLPKVRNRFQRLLLGWLAFWKGVRLRSDIYHIHDPELIPVGLMLRMWTRKPVIYDVHEVYPEAIQDRTWIAPFLRKALARSFDRFERFLAGSFNAIITADELISERFPGKGIPIVTIYNFPERAYFSDESLHPSFPQEHQVQLIYAGAIAPQRGLWVMLEMMEILLDRPQSDIGLWLVGKIESEAEREKIEVYLAERSDLSSRVGLVGWIPFNEVPSYLRQADIGLVPLQPIAKYYKNIPTKQFEYMAAGLPIVGSDLPPIRKFLEESESGLIASPGDPGSFAEKVQYLIDNPDQAARLGRNGERAFKERYNWDSEEAKLLSLYEQLLEKPAKDDQLAVF